MYKLNNADIKEWAKNYKGELFDGILCDPPYELGFMGKSWDNSGIAFDTEMWADLYKLLKPGAHLLAFSGSRTYHRMACAIEDAGFEIRDMIEWVYGSGFPKSLNIGKAVDRLGGQSLSWFIDYILKVADEKGISRKELTMLFPSKNGNPTGWLWNKQKTQGITLEQYHKIKEFLQLPFADITECEREIVGRGKAGLTAGTIANFTGEKEFDLTKGTSEWEGYGTALKPAHEPCVLARKPLDKGMTVAGNVLKHGTGGLNIDGTRVGTEQRINNANGATAGGARIQQLKPGVGGGEVTGRFPANLIHDGSDEVEAVFPQTGKSRPDHRNEPSSTGDSGIYGKGYKRQPNMLNDSGSASRFFYTAKASRAERSKGLDSTVSIKVQLEICENNITRQENLARLQVVMDNSHLKATAESGTGTKSGTEWSMSLFGNQYTEKYPINIKSTTKTTTNSTTTSVILNWLIGLLTNESTLGVSLEMENGGSPADGVESFSTLTATISDQTALALGVNPALASKRLLISVSDGKNFHSTVKPLSLTKYLATLIKPPTGGRLLVPFSGSGSEIIGALQAGWEYVEGVELTDEYIPIAEARIKHWIKQPVQESLL